MSADINETEINPIELAKALLKSVAAEQGWPCEGNRARVTKRFDLEIRQWDLGVVVLALRNWRKVEGVSDQDGREKILELARLLQKKQQDEEAKRRVEPEVIVKDDLALLNIVADRFVKQTGYRLDHQFGDERSNGVCDFSLEAGPRGTIIKGIAMKALTTRFHIEVPTSLAFDIYHWLRKLDWLDRYNQQPEEAVKSPPVFKVDASIQLVQQRQ